MTVRGSSSRQPTAGFRLRRGEPPIARPWAGRQRPPWLDFAHFKRRKQKRPRRTGVVRAMARSDHWRWVSTPRWVLTSWKVTSSCQRRTNHSKIWVGSAAGSVHSKAWVAKAPWGSRINTQRMRTGGLPERYHTAVWEVSSTARVVPSYQATVALAHVTSACPRSVFNGGRRAPFSGGRPFCPG